MDNSKIRLKGTKGVYSEFDGLKLCLLMIIGSHNGQIVSINDLLGIYNILIVYINDLKGAL